MYKNDIMASRVSFHASQINSRMEAAVIFSLTGRTVIETVYMSLMINIYLMASLIYSAFSLDIYQHTHTLTHTQIVFQTWHKISFKG